MSSDPRDLAILEHCRAEGMDPRIIFAEDISATARMVAVRAQWDTGLRTRGGVYNSPGPIRVYSYLPDDTPVIQMEIRAGSFSEEELPGLAEATRRELASRGQQ